MIFNLIPAFPLDGGRVLRSGIWGISKNLRRATRWAAGLGQGFAWLMILVGVVSFVLGFEAGHSADPQLRAVGSGLMYQGIWLGLIGLFLNNAARESHPQVLIQQALRGEPISQFMNRQPIIGSPFLDLGSWVEDYVYRYHRKMFPVATTAYSTLGVGAAYHRRRHAPRRGCHHYSSDRGRPNGTGQNAKYGLVSATGRRWRPPCGDSDP